MCHIQHLLNIKGTETIHPALYAALHRWDLVSSDEARTGGMMKVQVDEC